jgi:hypothetical protein
MDKSHPRRSRPERNGLRDVLIRVIRTLGILLAVSLVLKADEPGILNLKVIEGDDAVYPIGSRATRGVTVLVSDERGRPVGGATVSFTLPSGGPGGVFASGGRTEIATTRADGRAAVWGMRWNRLPGGFQLRVMAIKGQARAGASAAQSLSDAPEAKAAAGGQRGGSGSHKVLWISLAAGAAAVAGIAGAGFARSSTVPATAAAAAAGPLQIGTPTITLGRP